MGAKAAVAIMLAAVAAAVFLAIGLRRFGGQDKRTVDLIADIEKSPWWSAIPPPGTIREIAEKIQSNPPGVFLISRSFKLTVLSTAESANIKSRTAAAVVDTTTMAKSTLPAVLAEIKAAVAECLRSFGPASSPNDRAPRQ